MPGSRLTILLACLLIRRDSLNAGQSIPACQNCSPFCSESTFGIGASPCRHGLLMKEEPRRRCCKRRRLAKVAEGLAAIGELDRHEPTAAEIAAPAFGPDALRRGKRPQTRRAFHYKSTLIGWRRHAPCEVQRRSQPRTQLHRDNRRRRAYVRDSMPRQRLLSIDKDAHGRVPALACWRISRRRDNRT
jgi:hypothetical protein